MKNNLFKLLLAAAIFFGLTLNSFRVMAQTTNSSPTKFTDKQDRYSMTVPAGWKMYDDEYDVYFEYDSSEFLATFFVDGFPFAEGENITLEELTADITDYDSVEEGFEAHIKVIEKIKATVDGVPAVRIIQKSTIKENIGSESFSDIAIIDEYYFIKNNHAYLLSFSVHEMAYDKLKGDFEAIAKSFKTGTKPFENYMDEPDTEDINEPVN